MYLGVVRRRDDGEVSARVKDRESLDIPNLLLFTQVRIQELHSRLAGALRAPRSKVRNSRPGASSRRVGGPT